MLVLCNTRKAKAKQNKNHWASSSPHTQAELTVGKMCPSINEGYLSAGHQLIWLAVSLVWTKLSVSPSYWIYSPFSHSYKYKIRMYMYFHQSSFFSLFCSTAQAFLWHLKAFASLWTCLSRGKRKKKCFTVSNLSLQWTLALKTPTHFPKTKSRINVPDFLVQFQSLEEDYRP